MGDPRRCTRERHHRPCAPAAVGVQVLQGQPRLSGAPVFGHQHSSVFLQIRNASGVHGWTVHDLRRSCSSLLSRARVSTEVAERVLGHRIRGVEQIYNRHEYFEEKSHALATLAQLIESILSPAGGNVIALGSV
jgi:integrase